jgi:hypothetical protein
MISFFVEQEQELVFNRVTLKDHFLLVDVGLMEGSTISLMLRTETRARMSKAEELGLDPPIATCVAAFPWSGDIPVRGDFVMCHSVLIAN